MADPEIIKDHPIEGRLREVHSQFKEVCDKLGIPASADSVQQVFNDRTLAKPLIDGLIFAVISLPAVQFLPSPQAKSESLLVDLAALVTRFRKENLTFELFIPLVRNIVDKAPDAEIWNAVYELVTPSKPTNNKNLASHTRTPSQTSTILRALQKDWSNPYFPDSLTALRDLIRRYQLRDIDQYYAKTLVFIQSSGMGKSRLADVFGQHCPMINFILREPGTSGFPPPDEEILSFLRSKQPANILELTRQPGQSKELSPGKSKESLQVRIADVAWNHTLVAALLQASFETLHDWVENEHLNDDTMTLGQLAKERHRQMATLAPHPDAEDARSQRSKIRVEFCESVAARAEAIADVLISNPNWMRKFGNDKESQVHHELEKEHSDEHPNPLNDLLLAAERLTAILRQYRDANYADSLLVIVFDEASSLLRTPPSDKIHTGLYVALNRIISCLKKFRVWSFFLATESLVGHLVPPSNAVRAGDYDYLRDSSARISRKSYDTELKRFPPFVSLQLDVEDRRKMKDATLREEELHKSLMSFAKREHMAQFGRPLWYAYIDQVEEMASLAKMKLIGGQRWGAYNPTVRDHVFAALSFRLSLDVCLQNPRTISLSMNAVNYHMRVVISMDQETGVMDTLTPSEPILARAAMEHLCKGNWPRSIQTLCEELLDRGLIEKGRKGELYARLVLILAHDWVRGGPSLQSGHVPAFAPTFSVSDFLMALYADGHHDSIRHIPGQILEAKMNFTHFVPLHEKLTPKVVPELCHDLLRRSAAMQLSWQQETYDLLIPVYYGPEDEAVDPSQCGVIVVQVKNQQRATNLNEIFQEDFINISPNTSDPAPSTVGSPQRNPTKFVFNQMANPVLYLLFDLGVVRNSQSTAPPVRVMQSRSKLLPELWAIHSRGHDDAIFGCLQRMNITNLIERFFASVKAGEKTKADRLALRNRTFYRAPRSFRYEKEDADTEVQEGEPSDHQSKGEGAVIVEEGEASNNGSERDGLVETEGESRSDGGEHVAEAKDKKPLGKARRFVQTHLPLRRRSDRAKEGHNWD